MYVGTFSVDPINVADPLDPVVVNVIAFCLLENVNQSVDAKNPFVVLLACGIDIVFVPLFQTNGVVAMISDGTINDGVKNSNAVPKVLYRNNCCAVPIGNAFVNVYALSHCVCFAVVGNEYPAVNVNAKVPDVVIVPGATENPVGTVIPIDVTDPPPTVHDLSADKS